MEIKTLIERIAQNNAENDRSKAEMIERFFAEYEDARRRVGGGVPHKLHQALFRAEASKKSFLSWLTRVCIGGSLGRDISGAVDSTAVEKNLASVADHKKNLDAAIAAITEHLKTNPTQ